MIPSPQSEVLIAKPQAKPLFVDKRYHLPSLSQGTLAGVRGDEGLLVYLIPRRGL